MPDTTGRGRAGFFKPGLCQANPDLQDIHSFVFKLLILPFSVRENRKVSELKFLVYKLIVLSLSCEGR